MIQPSDSAQQASPIQPPSRFFRGGWAILVGLLLISGGVFGIFVQVNTTTHQSPAFNPGDVIRDRPLQGTYGLSPSRSLVSGSVAVPDGGIPALELGADFADLGRIRVTERPVKIFVLRNSGVGTLTITELYTTCEYITASLSGSIIPPGKIALLSLTLDANLAYELNQRHVRRGAILETNDPRNEEVAVWVEAIIQP